MSLVLLLPWVESLTLPAPIVAPTGEAGHTAVAVADEQGIKRSALLPIFWLPEVMMFMDLAMMPTLLEAPTLRPRLRLLFTNMVAPLVSSSVALGAFEPMSKSPATSVETVLLRTSQVAAGMVVVILRLQRLFADTTRLALGAALASFGPTNSDQAPFGFEPLSAERLVPYGRLQDRSRRWQWAGVDGTSPWDGKCRWLAVPFTDGRLPDASSNVRVTAGYRGVTAARAGHQLHLNPAIRTGRAAENPQSSGKRCGSDCETVTVTLVMVPPRLLTLMSEG